MKGLEYLLKGLTVAVLSVAMCSCGGSDGEDDIDVSGAWYGTGSFVSPSSGQTVTGSTSLEFVQNGKQLAGTWDGAIGFTGSVDGNSVNITIAPTTYQGTIWTGVGSFVIDGNESSMSGSIDVTLSGNGQSVSVRVSISVTRASRSAKDSGSQSDCVVTKIVDLTNAR